MKIGILTFHYSNNYGGILQCYALQSVISEMGYNVEVINYIPSKYNPYSILDTLGISRNILKNSKDNLNVIDIIKKIDIKNKNNKLITNKFDNFRKDKMKLSNKVDENSIDKILNQYDIIVVGSDQVWNPGQRKNREYFLDFGENFYGRKISYAADSTTENIDSDDIQRLKKVLGEFDFISVRNRHSYNFVKSLISKHIDTVADPTLLYNFNDICIDTTKEEYILTYILGEEIDGSNKKTIEKIKKTYGNIPVYSIVIPNMNFKINNYADKTLYNLGPQEWITMFKNAKFIYTDSFHGVLFSLKFHKPFLAYYTEKLRATRFIDLKERYKIEKYIVENIDEIDIKGSLNSIPNFDEIDNIIKNQVDSSIKYLNNAIKNGVYKVIND